MITRDQFKAIVTSAARAPSVHNTQAFRFRLRDGNVIELWGASDRVLHIGDPRLKDHLISVGAALEGIRLALSECGLSLDHHVETFAPDKSAPVHLIARGRVNGSAVADPLANYVHLRKAYRGNFKPVPADALERVRVALDEVGHCKLILKPASIRRTASLYDSANRNFVQNPEYASELIQWLRLAPSHPDFNRDGLNADCLALTGLERIGAQIIFSPKVFSWLMRLPFGPGLVSESSKIKSSSFVLALFQNREEDLLHVGARFYRTWLTLTRFGISACPLSALVDHEPTAEEFLQSVLEGRIGASQRLVNVFRCGMVPDERVATSPRLPVEELILDG